MLLLPGNSLILLGMLIYVVSRDSDDRPIQPCRYEDVLACSPLIRSCKLHVLEIPFSLHAV